eukprot:jgi/Mesen1/8031/ME000427S07320
MAGNEWVTGYLDAILGSGAPLDKKDVKGKDKQGKKLTTDGLENSSRGTIINYFVQEITGSNELDLHKTWQKATATKNTQEKGSRMENFCWRIWHLMRKKKQMEWEEVQRQAQRRLEKEEGQADVSEDMPEEDMEEGERHADSDSGAQSDSGPQPVQIAEAVDMKTPSAPTERKLYIVMISLHGLVRGDNMELGRDSDTGGQIKYVVEFARALATMPQVYRVDLLTRQITAGEVDWSYGEPTEMLTTPQYDEDGDGGESAGAYIVRIPCGARDKYIQKELLWPHIPEFVDGALSHVVHMSRVLGEQIGGGQPVWPYVIHGHYADAGDIASLLSGALNVPMVLTGHSLGRNKLEQLLKQGRQTHDINATYKIMRRIEAEEFSLDAAELVVTSTRQEIDQQWGLYDGFDVKLERILRARQKRGVSTHGRYMPRMSVLPPGMDFSHVIVSDAADVLDTGAENVGFASNDASVVTPVSPRPNPPIWAEIGRFFQNPHKPMVLALARPDPKKNITTLLKAYGENPALRELANLTLVMGNRDDIDEMSGGNAEVLTTVLKLIDKYDMYGQVAYPKHHKQSDVPEIYRLAAKSKGVFVNPALVEPFGLTLIEAAAYGLPMVATKNGGPVDIQRALSNGVLVDPHDDKGIADALLKLVGDRAVWSECRRNGLRNIHVYSWPEHCRTYLGRVAQCRMRHAHWRTEGSVDMAADVESQEDSLRDVRDLSLALSIDGRGSLTDPAEFQKLLDRANAQRLETMQEEQDPDASSAPARPPPGAPPSSALRSRKSLVILATDSYLENGEPHEYLAAALKSIVAAAKSSRGVLGVGLATALTGPEVLKLLTDGGVDLQDLDLVIAGSGSELYYTSAAPSASGEQQQQKGVIADGKGAALILDTDYEEHVEYRWGGDGLRRSMARVIAAASEGTGERAQRALAEDEKRCSSRRLTYRVLDASQAPTADALRKRLRMRGLRCHVVYCRSATTLHLLPLHASRAQALRYLYVRWGVDVANMTLLVGKGGDTDSTELLSGTHRTLVVPAPIGIPDKAKNLMAKEVDFSILENVHVKDKAQGSESVGQTLQEMKIV